LRRSFSCTGFTDEILGDFKASQSRLRSSSLDLQEHKTPIPYEISHPRKVNVFDVINVLDEKYGGVAGKNFFVRVDFNVPMSSDGEITDDSRIRGALPTIQTILHAKGNAILASHMGRPKLVQKGGTDDATNEQRKKLSLKPAAERLQLLLKNLGHDIKVVFASDCIGSAAEEAVAALPSEGGGIVVLENLRFYKDEEKNSTKFASSLSDLSDAYINDAFGTAHRAHASVSGIPALKSPELCGIGCLIASELEYLDFANVDSTNSSLCAIIGGSKVSTKLPVIEGLIKQVDMLVLGGGLAFTFVKALGVPIGNSLLEESMVDTAAKLMEQANSLGKKIIIPVDAVCSDHFPKGPMKKEDTITFDLTPGNTDAGIKDGWMGLDVGPKTLSLIKESLAGTTKLVFNGPLGVFEIPPFDAGTKSLVHILEDMTKNQNVITVVGGGDSVAALEQFGKSDVVSYISTGGGATLELLSGDVLPGVAAIDDFKGK